MKIKVLIFTFLSMFLLASCNSAKRGVSCKTKPLKQKKYSIQTQKVKKRPITNRSSVKTTNTNKVNTEPKIETQQENTTLNKPNQEQKNTKPITKPTTTQQPKQQQTENAPPLSIADSKVGGIPILAEPDLKEVAEELNEGEQYSFEKTIEFISDSDLFQNRDLALNKLSELASVLNKTTDLTITIIGNTATEIPDGEEEYGNSSYVYEQKVTLNRKEVTRYDLMIARADRIRKLLLEKGVRENQLNTKAGTHRKYAKDRTVTFILKRN